MVVVSDTLLLRFWPRSRIAHIEFPDYANDELLAVAELMLHDARQPSSGTSACAEPALYAPAPGHRLVTDLDHVLTAEGIMSPEASGVLASRVSRNAFG